jgi:hypothetical protein
MNKKVSFDFDATLSRPSVQAYAKELVDKGFEVWIVTLRFENPSKDPLYGHEYNNDELYCIADNIGISREHIVFTGLVDKGEYFSQHDDFIFHLDDNFEQIKHIKDNTKNVGCVWLFNFSLDQSKWIEECNDLIKDNGR